MLQLNAFLLRQGISPVRAISTASLPDTSFALWTNNRLEPLEVADGDLLDAAVPGDVIVALVRRPIAPPAWQQFIQDALALPDFGRASSALGCDRLLRHGRRHPGWRANPMDRLVLRPRVAGHATAGHRSPVRAAGGPQCHCSRFPPVASGW